MSIEENKAVVRRWVEGWNEHGVGAVDELFSQQFLDHQSHGDVPGLDPFKDRLTGLEGELGRGRFEEEEMLAEGDKVLVRWTLHARHQGPFAGLPPTGREFTLPGLNIFRVQDGRITERWTFLDLVALLPQLGARIVPAE